MGVTVAHRRSGTPCPSVRCSRACSQHSLGADTRPVRLGGSALPDPLTRPPLPCHPAHPISGPPPATRALPAPADPTLLGLPPAPGPHPRCLSERLSWTLTQCAGPHCCPGAPTPPGSDAPVTGLACFPAISPLGWKPPKGQAKCGGSCHSLTAGWGSGEPLRTPLDNRHHEGTAVGGGLPAPAESLPGTDTASGSVALGPGGE